MAYHANTIEGMQNDIQAPQLDWASGQVVAVGAASVATTNAVNSRYNVLAELSSNANCWYTVGVAPTASAGAGSAYLAAGSVRYVFILSGSKVAFIQDGTSTGTVAIIPTTVVSR